MISSLLFATGVDEKALALLARGVACRGRARSVVVDRRAFDSMLVVLSMLMLVMKSMKEEDKVRVGV